MTSICDKFVFTIWLSSQKLLYMLWILTLTILIWWHSNSNCVRPQSLDIHLNYHTMCRYLKFFCDTLLHFLLWEECLDNRGALHGLFIVDIWRSPARKTTEESMVLARLQEVSLSVQGSPAPSPWSQTSWKGTMRGKGWTKLWMF